MITFNVILFIYLLGVLFVLWNLYDALKEHHIEDLYTNKRAFIFTIIFMASCSWLIVLYCLIRRKGDDNE